MAVIHVKILLAKRYRAKRLRILEEGRICYTLQVRGPSVEQQCRMADFAHSNLCVETYGDAACPYGKTINGFVLVEGWRIRYLLCLVAASLVGSICVAAVGWVYGRSMVSGLTAGTYAVTVTAVPLGVLTFLSAVL